MNRGNSNYYRHDELEVYYILRGHMIILLMFKHMISLEAEKIHIQVS